MSKLPRDYSRCVNTKCKKKKSCLRFTDIPDGIYFISLFNEKDCKVYIKDK